MNNVRDWDLSFTGAAGAVCGHLAQREAKNQRRCVLSPPPVCLFGIMVLQINLMYALCTDFMMMMLKPIDMHFRLLFSSFLASLGRHVD